MLSMLIQHQLQCTTERAALYSIYKDNGGLNGYWIENNWFTTDPDTNQQIPICDFDGVTCDYQTNSLVTELDLSYFNISGIISDQLSCLTYLKAFNISHQTSYTWLPSTFSQLSNLQYFTAEYAGLSNNLSTVNYCVMRNLKYFYASNNYLNGSLPVCTSSQARRMNIIEIHLFCNENLTGQIPQKYYNMPYLTEFRIQCNPDINCTRYLYQCGMMYSQCDECEDYIIITVCPPYVEVEECGQYYPLSEQDIIDLTIARQARNTQDN